MTFRRHAPVGAVLAAGLLFCGIALAATRYPDRSGDVTGGPGPDITSIAISNTATAITFRIQFATAPPLRLSTSENWVDMLLVSIDVPPLGPKPVAPGGPWLGANYALGAHGPSKRGLLVRTGRVAPGVPRLVATFPIVTRGSTLTFSIARRALGRPGWFTFSAAAARELQESTGGGIDVIPARGTFRYTLT